MMCLGLALAGCGGTLNHRLIALLGNYMASTFAPSSDGHGGTNLVDHASTDQTSLVAQPSH
jgi:hypothetical protein